jgi:hypothetical protein
MTIAALLPDGAKNHLVVKADIHFSAEPGDEVTFFRPQTGTILVETQVKSVARVEGGWDVEFADSLPADLSIEGSLVTSDQIWNRSKSCGDFVVRHNRLERIRRFGVVFRAKTGVIEENHFQGTSASAIIFLNETQYPNGLYPSNIIIRNNVIQDCAFDAMPTAALTMLFKRLGGAEPAQRLPPARARTVEHSRRGAEREHRGWQAARPVRYQAGHPEKHLGYQVARPRDSAKINRARSSGQEFSIRNSEGVCANIFWKQRAK